MGKLFGTSGIRGKVNQTLTPEEIIKIGAALATHLGGSGEVVVGRDPRTSGELFERSLMAGLLGGGCEVIKVGVVPTPAVGFATKELEAKAGVMVTASHNPPEFNGVKLFDDNGMSFSPELEEKVERIYFGNKSRLVSWDKIPQVRCMDVLPEYMEKITSSVSLRGKYKVVVDCGNGAGAKVTPYLFRKLGCKVVTLNSNLDGHFSGRGAEPTSEALEDLCGLVKSTGADIGIAHDGDADRVAVVDDSGKVSPPDKVLALIAAAQVRRKGDVIVTTVDASKVVNEAVARRGGKVVRTRVGDVAVALEVKNSGAVFGGEPSGAWIFPNVHMAPDGPLSAVKVVELLDKSREKLSKSLGKLPDHFMIRRKISCTNEKKPTKLKNFLSMARKEFREGKISTVDGVRVSFREGWILVRPSGTEPIIRLTVEGDTEKWTNKMTQKAIELLG